MHIVSRASVAEGFAAMAANPLRTTLCTLGVVMGIASVIATLALTDGLDRYVRQQIVSSTDVQAVAISSRTQIYREGFSFPNRSFPIFTLKDADELQDFLGRDGTVTMSVGGSGIVETASATAHAASVNGTLSNWLVFGSRDVFAGRYFTDIEVRHNAPVIVLSYKLATELSPTGAATSMLGREVRLQGHAFTTVGIMPSYTGETTFGVFIPLRALGPVLGVQKQITPMLLVRAPTLERVDATKARVIDWIAMRYRDWDRRVSVTTQLARLEQTRAAMLIAKIVLGAFAGISLIVGGVGIMNVLLASVTERTREIGVRKAMGARRRDILYQFLAESVAMASVGTGLGTVIGFVSAFSVAALVRWRVPGATMYAAVTPATIATAIIAAATIGLTFGTLPAVRASRLSPIDAIRHE
ncbi:MAG TPA: ABC transporter permease [Gemmatimonadaceae bacterium]|jgi:putative ABC transport system permease protein